MTVVIPIQVKTLPAKILFVNRLFKVPLLKYNSNHKIMHNGRTVQIVNLLSSLL